MRDDIKQCILNIACQNLYDMSYKPETHISPQQLPAQGLIWHMIQILTCHVHYMIYLKLYFKCVSRPLSHTLYHTSRPLSHTLYRIPYIAPLHRLYLKYG